MPFNVELLENQCAYYLAVDSTEKREYSNRHRVGLLKRENDSNWRSQAQEYSSLLDAAQQMGLDKKIKNISDRAGNVNFQAVKILREHQPLLSFLQAASVHEWKLVFRASQKQRLIVRAGQLRESNLRYYSVLVKLKMSEGNGWIEIGEGHTADLPRFNQDGLILRIKDVLRNQNEAREVHFNGPVPVILNSGDGGIFFHELLGHSLEADYVYQKLSPISLDHLNQPIISPAVTLGCHDAADEFFRDVPCDDEGEPLASDVLVEQGVLRHFIADYYYKERLRLDHCGHSRLEDFTRIPLPRMFALYLHPGTYHPQELVESTRYGVFAKEFGAGKVYFDKNVFYFDIKEAFLVEDGQLTWPLGRITVCGNIHEVLNSIAMVADDFRYDKGISYCYKNGQTVNVRVGQPTVKIDNIHITRDIND